MIGDPQRGGIPGERLLAVPNRDIAQFNRFRQQGTAVKSNALALNTGEFSRPADQRNFISHVVKANFVHKGLNQQ